MGRLDISKDYSYVYGVEQEQGPAMIAALYALKSTDQNIADEEKSVARQV